MTRIGLWMGCAAVLASATAMCAQTAGLLAVVNQKEHAVVLVDPTTHKPVSTISVGVNGHELAASPDGKLLYVPIYSNVGVGKAGTDGRTIDVIDVASRKLVTTIDLGRPLRPHKPIFGPDGYLYVTGELAQAIQIVDVNKRAIVGQIPTGAPESHMLVLSADGKRGYTANVGPGSVSVLDIANRKLVKVIPLTKTVQRIAISNDQRWVFTSDTTLPRVAVIDTKTNALSRWVATGGLPYVTQPTADGKFLLVAERKDGKGLLEVVDLFTWKVVRSFPLAADQNGGFLLHDGLVYLSEPLGGTIEILNPKTWTLEAPIVLTLGVDGLAWTR